MTAFTLSSLRRGVYPWPVYEATYADGTKRRMSFWTNGRKAVDFGRGRRLLELSGRSVDAPNGARCYQAERRGWIVSGVVHLPDGTCLADPHFGAAPEVVAIKPRSAKKVAAEALALLRAGDVDGAAAALAALAA